MTPTDDRGWKSSEFRKFRSGSVAKAATCDDAAATASSSTSFLNLWPRVDSLNSSLENNLNVSLNNNNGLLERSNMVEPLKILTNEFAENLGLHSKDFDSGYLSPNNTNGYHLPGKPGLHLLPSNEPPKFSFGFGDDSFLPPIPSRSPETPPFDSSPPPVIGFGRLPSSSSSSVRGSRPNSQDLEALMKTGLGSKLRSNSPRLESNLLFYSFHYAQLLRSF